MTTTSASVLEWTRYAVMSAAWVCIVGPHPAWAQGATPAVAAPTWTIAVHGGAVFGQTPTGGSPLAQFPAGATFTTEVGFPSRANPSWYFGDGAHLFNQVNAQFAALFNQRFAQIVPLDDMLKTAGARRRRGGSFGVRVARRLSSRYGAELSVDRSRAPLKFTDAAKTAIEATRAGFASAFTGLLATAPVTGARASSTAEILEPPGRQTWVAGALTVSLMTTRRLAAHAAAGVGGLFNRGVSEVRLRGNYQFNILGTFPVNETDTVTIRVADRDRAICGMLGAGLTYDMSARHGLRVDVRVCVSQNRLETSVDATPSVAIVSPFAFLPSLTNPSVQFSTTAGIRSTLGGEATGLKTFTGDGIDTRTNLTVGYFFRF